MGKRVAAIVAAVVIGVAGAASVVHSADAKANGLGHSISAKANGLKANGL